MKMLLACLTLVALAGCASPYEYALHTTELVPPPGSNGTEDAEAALPYEQSPDFEG